MATSPGRIVATVALDNRKAIRALKRARRAARCAVKHLKCTTEKK